MDIHTTGVGLDDEKGEYIVREYHETGNRNLRKPRKRSTTLGEKKINEDIYNSPPASSEPALRKDTSNKANKRDKKCVSVMIEPASPWKKHVLNNPRMSMYELGTAGWIFNSSKDALKKILNLDDEIKTILEGNSSVDVTLGGIRITF